MAYIQERKTLNGAMSYRVQVRLKGYPIQTATFERKTDARKWVQQTEAAIREGRHFKTSAAKKHTLADLINRYIRDVLPTKPKSQKKQAAQLNWWKEQIGSYTLADVTPSLIAEYRDILLQGQTIRNKQRSPATAIRYLAALSHAFTIGIKEWGWIENNPILKITKPKEPRGRVRFLSDDEREKLLVAAKESKSEYLYLIIVLCLSTGARKMEILGLKWQNVDLERGIITLHETKNGERRILPIAGHALELMKQHYAATHSAKNDDASDNVVADVVASAAIATATTAATSAPPSLYTRLNTDLVFPSNYNPKQPIDIRTPFETALKRAEISDFRFHDLRHSAASYLAMNGASLAEIAEVLGHKTLQMVKRYAHLSEAHTAGVVARMNERIFGGGSDE